MRKGENALVDIQWEAAIGATEINIIGLDLLTGEGISGLTLYVDGHGQLHDSRGKRLGLNIKAGKDIEGVPFLEGMEAPA